MAELHARLEVWDAPSVMMLGVRVHDKPVGETADINDTVPVKPLIGDTVTVELAIVPTVVVMLAGLAETEKSVTVYVTVALWESDPLLPVTVTV